MTKITVFTPTYNRKSKLRRAFNSLQNQTSKDFVWLIIDDGSTDGTYDLINDLINEASFPIEYHWKENGGRHTAANLSYQYIRTPYVVTLDSDDELVPNAVEMMIQTWEDMLENKRKHCWCISGREAYFDTGKMIGNPYPKDINKYSGKQLRKIMLRYPGEKHCCRRTDILVNYPFPVYPDTKFVTENVVWEKINRKYDQYCTNDIYGLYHFESEDGLTNKGMHADMRHRTFYYAGLFYVNELLDEFFYNKQVPYYVVNVSRCAMLTHTSYQEVMSKISSRFARFLVTLGYPISWLWIITHHKKTK